MEQNKTGRLAEEPSAGGQVEASRLDIHADRTVNYHCDRDTFPAAV